MIVIAFICLSCFSYLEVGLATIKTFLMLLFLLKLLFSCMLRSVAFYIRYKMGRFRFGGRLRGLKV